MTFNRLCVIITIVELNYGGDITIIITCDTKDKAFVKGMLDRECTHYKVRKLCGGYQFCIDTDVENFKRNRSKRSLIQC